MPESEQLNSPQAQLLALIALELDDSAAQGAVPSVEEIDLWRQNQLPESRALEVLSHLARDTDCLRQLRQLQELDEIELSVPSVAQLRAQSETLAGEENAAGKGSNSLIDRVAEWLGIGVGPALAGGVGFVLMALLIVPIMMKPPAHMTGLLQQDFERWASESSGAFEPLPLHGKSSLVSGPELSQLRQGAWNAVKDRTWSELPVWKNWAADLDTVALTECGDAAACEDKTEFYQALGQWFLAVFHDCEQGADSLDDFVATAASLETEGYLVSSEIGAALLGASKQSPAELCRLSADVLGL